MMEKEKLRKADVFSGAVVMFTGIMIIWQGTRMPMTDSYGGVQNVWYVSPALFPLFVGAMLLLLGGGLVRTALRAVGIAGVAHIMAFLCSRELLLFLQKEETVRYYGIVFNLLVFVFLLVPHVDFFLAAVFFLLILFCMFYCGDHLYLMRLLRWEIAGVVLFCGALFSGVTARAASILLFPADWLILLAISGIILASTRKFSADTEQRRRYVISLLVALIAPFTVGIIFKYFLMVPMPFEGLVVTLLDAIWYADFWS